MTMITGIVWYTHLMGEKPGTGLQQDWNHIGILYILPITFMDGFVAMK